MSWPEFWAAIVFMLCVTTCHVVDRHHNTAREQMELKQGGSKP